MAKPVSLIGLADLISALNQIDRELSKGLRAELKEVARVVAADAQEKLAGLSPSPARSVGGIVPRVRSVGLVTVEQKYRRTTGRRPDWGVTQMKNAFLPAADENEDVMAEMIQVVIDRVAASHGF